MLRNPFMFCPSLDTERVRSILVDIEMIGDTTPTQMPLFIRVRIQDLVYEDCSIWSNLHAVMIGCMNASQRTFVVYIVIQVALGIGFNSPPNQIQRTSALDFLRRLPVTCFLATRNVLNEETLLFVLYAGYVNDIRCNALKCDTTTSDIGTTHQLFPSLIDVGSSDTYSALYRFSMEIEINTITLDVMSVLLHRIFRDRAMCLRDALGMTNDLLKKVWYHDIEQIQPNDTLSSLWIILQRHVLVELFQKPLEDEKELAHHPLRRSINHALTTSLTPRSINLIALIDTFCDHYLVPALSQERQRSSSSIEMYAMTYDNEDELESRRLRVQLHAYARTRFNMRVDAMEEDVAIDAFRNVPRRKSEKPVWCLYHTQALRRALSTTFHVACDASITTYQTLTHYGYKLLKPEKEIQ